MSGQGFFAVVQVIMSSVPAVIYLVSGYLIGGGAGAITAGTIVAFTTVQARLLMPLMGLMRVALDVQTSSALFARIFEYLDLRPAIVDAPDALPVSAAPGPLGRIEFATSSSATPTPPNRLVRLSTASRSRSSPVSTSPSWGPRARARRPSCTSHRACTRRRAAR